MPHESNDGYRLVQRTESMAGVKGAFEGLAHYQDLYHGPIRLGTVGQYSISPSRDFALFEDNGRLMLFGRTTRTIRDVTDGGFALPAKFDWNEGTGFVEVTYYGAHPVSRIVLQSGRPSSVRVLRDLRG